MYEALSFRHLLCFCCLLYGTFCRCAERLGDAAEPYASDSTAAFWAQSADRRGDRDAAHHDLGPYTPLANLNQDEALRRALTQRADLQAADAGVRAAELALKAARAERLPSLVVNGDFGASGVTPTNHSDGVYNVSGTLTVPLYQGGRIHADEDVARATLRQRTAERDDTRGQVDQDVRQAFIDLTTAADQVGVAQNNRELAHEALTQSTDRFLAGVADTVEVVQAEQAVVQADDDYITAVFDHNLGKVSLARAMGSYVDTDDAFVEGHTDPMSFRISGIVTAVYVENTYFVKKGQLLAQLDDRDNEVAKEQAGANYAQAQAAVRAQSPNVPIVATDQTTRIRNEDFNVVSAQANVAASEERFRSALADLHQAEAQQGNAAREEQRYRQLVVKEEVTREQYDQRATEERAEAAVVASRRETAEAASRAVTQAVAQLGQAHAQAEQARLEHFP